MLGRWTLIGFLLLAALTLLGACRGSRTISAVEREKVFGLDNVFYMYGGNKSHVSSLNIIHSGPKEWQEIKAQGAVPTWGQVWFPLLRNPVEEAVRVLTEKDFAGNPHPVVQIDEFGFDYGGETDQKTATLLRATKGKMPELDLIIWQMRGPISPVLAACYRDVVELLCLECYVGGKDDYWKIAVPVMSARLQGLMPRAIVGIGLGVGGKPGEFWARTKTELEQQVRFVRHLAPESPGLGFFWPGSAEKGEEGLLEFTDELCKKFNDIPTDGSGLPPDVMALAQKLRRTYEKPLVVGSGKFVEPNRSWTDPSTLVKPFTMKTVLLNLGNQDAWNVKVRVRESAANGGDVFAEGMANIPARGVASPSLPVLKEWKGWKDWDLEIIMQEGDVLILPESK